MSRRRDSARAVAVTFGMAAAVAAPFALNRADRSTQEGAAVSTPQGRVLRWTIDGRDVRTCAVLIKPFPTAAESR